VHAPGVKAKTSHFALVFDDMGAAQLRGRLILAVSIEGAAPVAPFPVWRDASIRRESRLSGGRVASVWAL